MKKSLRPARVYFLTTRQIHREGVGLLLHGNDDEMLVVDAVRKNTHGPHVPVAVVGACVKDRSLWTNAGDLWSVQQKRLYLQ